MNPGLSRVAAAAAVLALAPTVALMLLWQNGATSIDPELGFTDPGALTRWGLPAAQSLRDIFAAVTIAALTLVVLVLPPEDASRAATISGIRAQALSVAMAAAMAWTAAGWGVLWLAFADLAGLPPSSPMVRAQLWSFATDFELGRLLFFSMLLSSIVAIGCAYTRGLATTALLGLIAVAALWPVALAGHAAGSGDHDLAANTQFAHAVAICVWVGGVLTLALMRNCLADSLPVIARRFSHVAGWCYTIVAVTGVTAAFLRVPAWSDLASGYGVLLALKSSMFLALGLIGLQFRRRLLPRIDDGARQRMFTRLLGVEALLMAAAVGTAVALSRTPPPGSPGEPLSTAELLLGHAMPPPLTVERFFLTWQVDSFWAPAAVTLATLYAVGVHRLRRRGDRWPLGRQISWTVGCALLLWSTSGSPGAYGEVLFSMHMVQHMTLATGIPTFLVLGAPVTLALRALRRRDDGSRGPREWLLVIVHSPVARLLGHPIVAAAMFIVSLVVFYYSPLFEQSLRSHTVHVWMVTHFLITGYLFANVIVGVDPGPARPPYPLRVLLLMTTFGFHAFFSVSLMASSQVLAETWFGGLGRDWGKTLADDQYLGASLGWGLGDYPLGILGLALIWSWVKADHNEARRLDRASERDGGRDLAEYNDYLRRLADHNLDRR